MRKISDNDEFVSGRLLLRLVRPQDCTERYLGWLRDPEINQYLETRYLKSRKRKTIKPDGAVLRIPLLLKDPEDWKTKVGKAMPLND